MKMATKKGDLQEHYISFETALLAKLKGLNKLCKKEYDFVSIYDVEGNVSEEIYGKVLADATVYFRITQALAQKWLREVHRIEIEIDAVFEIKSNTTKYDYMVYFKGNLCFDNTTPFDSYEEALEFALSEGLCMIDKTLIRTRNKTVLIDD
jgi:hypothetical protein